MIRALRLLRDSTDGRQRRIFLACVVVLVSLAVLLLHLMDKADDAMIALFLVGLGIWMLWAFWFSRVLLVVVQARAIAMPLPWRDAALAWSFAAGATVLLPAACFAWAGIPVADALLALAAFALGGLVIAFVPAWCAALAGLLPMLDDLLDARNIALVTDGNVASWVLLLAVVAAWRGHAAAAKGAHLAAASVSRPLVFALAQACHRQGGVLAWRDTTRHLADTPSWLVDIGSTGGYGPRTPFNAMRAWLGSPFAPMRGRYRARQLAIVAVALVLFPMLTADGSEQAFRLSTLTWVAGFGGLMLAFLFPARVTILATRPAAEFGELALLPGFGDAARARATLLRAIALPAGVAFGVLLALVAGLAAYAGLDARGMGLLLVTIGGFALASALGCLRPLAGQPLGWAWLVLGVIVAIPLLVATGFAAAHERYASASALLPWVACAWLAVYGALGYCGHAAWGRLRARPHPFLQG